VLRSPLLSETEITFAAEHPAYRAGFGQVSAVLAHQVAEFA